MQEKRLNERYAVSLPVKVQWKDENGEEIVEEGKTEHVSRTGVLVHLPRRLPEVGVEVDLTVTEEEGLKELVRIKAQVLRVERNAAHPQCTLLLAEGNEKWEKKVWQYAAKIAFSSGKESEDEWVD